MVRGARDASRAAIRARRSQPGGRPHCRPPGRLGITHAPRCLATAECCGFDTYCRAATLTPQAAANARGFIGVVSRSTANGSHFENIYLRPTNGRTDDQLRRNHSVQYASLPDYPWYRLRGESPGKHESYADLVPDEWTHRRIVVRGRRAALFVNDAPQPCLVVTDLKMGTVQGKIGLWIGPGTRGYFSDMIDTPAGRP